MLSASALGGLIGIEHEYRVVVNGMQTDFRRLIHRLHVRGVRIDPADPNAYRCDWGGTITADGREAEVAIPPVRLAPGFTAAVESWCAVAHDALASLLPKGHELHGYSTHISVALPTRLAHRIAKAYARTFAPGLMLLMDRADSPGLLIRPRPDRLELGGEFVTGDALRAAVAYAVGSVLALARGLAPGALPARTEAAKQRYGVFVPRDAFGPDLYDAGRAATFASGETADVRLASSWVLARAELRSMRSDDLERADLVVSGAAPLPSEIPSAISPGAQARVAVSSAFGSMATPIVRPAFSARPVVATWDFVVFELSLDRRTLYANVPRDDLDGFRARLALGDLDDEIALRARRRWLRSTLRGRGQTGRIAYFDILGDARGLLAAERPSTISLPPGVPSFLSIRPGKGDARSPRLFGIPTNSILAGGAGILAGVLVFGMLARPTATAAPASRAVPSAVATVPASVQPGVVTSGPRTTSPTSYRVTGLPATYVGGPSCETQRVVLAWTIEGLGETGSYTIRFANGSGPYFGHSGPFSIRAGVGPSQSWDPPTGRLTLTQLVFDGGAGGRAEITSVRGLPVTGDPVSIAGPPPACAR